MSFSNIKVRPSSTINFAANFFIWFLYKKNCILFSDLEFQLILLKSIFVCFFFFLRNCSGIWSGFLCCNGLHNSVLSIHNGGQIIDLWLVFHELHFYMSFEKHTRLQNLIIKTDNWSGSTNLIHFLWKIFGSRPYWQ